MYERKQSWSNLRYSPVICLEAVRKSTIRLSHNRRFQDRNLIPGFSGYERAVLARHCGRQFEILHGLPQVWALYSAMMGTGWVRSTKYFDLSPLSTLIAKQLILQIVPLCSKDMLTDCWDLEWVRGRWVDRHVRVTQMFAASQWYSNSSSPTFFESSGKLTILWKIYWSISGAALLG